MKNLRNRAISLALAGVVFALNFSYVAYAAEPGDEASVYPSPLSDVNDSSSADTFATAETVTNETVATSAYQAETYESLVESSPAVLSDELPTITGFQQGSGTQDDPYLVSTAQELNDFAAQVAAGQTFSGQYIALADDIKFNNVSDYTAWSATSAPENVWSGLDGFAGTFDGQNHAIIGLYICRDEENTGFFNTTDPKACVVVKNLTLKNCFVHGTSNVGAIFGNPSYARIENCAVHGVVEGTGDNVGGFVGNFYTPGKRGLQIQNCASNVTVSGANYVGGFVGHSSVGNSYGMGEEYANGSEKIIFSDCINYGSVTATGDYAGGLTGCLFRSMNCGGAFVNNVGNEGAIKGGTNVGGICGFIQSEYNAPPTPGTVPLDCVYNIGSVSGYSYVGGICGCTKATDWAGIPITNAYNQGDITASYYAGGMVGGATFLLGGSLTVEKGYNIGTLSGSTQAASVAYSRSSNATVETKSFYYLDTSTSTASVGSTVDVVSLTAEQMKDSASFDKFDFSNEWKMGISHPILTWQDGGTIPEKPTAFFNKSDFTIGRDNFNFLNSVSDFFTGNERNAWDYKHSASGEGWLDKVQQWGAGFANWILHFDPEAYQTSYQISDESFSKLIEHEVPTVQDELILHRDNLWGGSCYGMAAVAMLRYTLKEQYPLYDDSGNLLDNIYDVTKPAAGEDNTVTAGEDLINSCHLMQYLPGFCWDLFVHYSPDFEISYTYALNNLVSRLESGSPVLFTIRRIKPKKKPDGSDTAEFVDNAHAICLLGIESETDDYYTVSVYDPNRTELTHLRLYKQPGIITGIFNISYFSSQNAQSSNAEYKVGFVDASVEDFLQKSNGQESASSSPAAELSIWSGQDTYISGGDFELAYVNNSTQIAKKLSDPFTYSDELLDEDDDGWLYYRFDDDVSFSDFTISLTPRNDNNAVSVKLMLNDWSFVVAGEGELQINVNATENSVTATSPTPGFKSIRITRNVWGEENCPWNTIVVDADDAKQLTLTPNAEGVTIDSDNLENAVVGGRKMLETAACELNTTETNATVLNPAGKSSDEVELALSHTISAAAQEHGTISPAGDVKVDYKANQSFTITPAQGYVIDDVLVDGTSVGSVSQYEFVSVTGNHTIFAKFKSTVPAPTAPPTATSSPVVTAAPSTPAVSEAPSPAGTPSPTASETPSSTRTPSPNATVQPSATEAPNTVTVSATPTPTESPMPTTTPTVSAEKIPQTGEIGHPFLWMFLSGTSLAAIAFLSFRKKRIRK